MIWLNGTDTVTRLLGARASLGFQKKGAHSHTSLVLHFSTFYLSSSSQLLQDSSNLFCYALTFDFRTLLLLPSKQILKLQ